MPSLNVAVSSAHPEQIRCLATGQGSAIRYVRPELYFWIAGFEELQASYIRGYRDGVNALTERLLAQNQGSVTDLAVQDEPAFTDNGELTWGLQAIALPKTTLTGAGVRVAILDTGFERSHPDFSNRGIESRSFINGVTSAQDDNGHGTHCLGTVAGPKSPSQGPRYGVASEAQVFVVKSWTQRAKAVKATFFMVSAGRCRTNAGSFRCRSARR